MRWIAKLLIPAGITAFSLSLASVGQVPPVPACAILGDPTTCQGCVSQGNDCHCAENIQCNTNHKECWSGIVGIQASTSPCSSRYKRVTMPCSISFRCVNGTNETNGPCSGPGSCFTNSVDVIENGNRTVYEKTGVCDPPNCQT